MKSVFKNITQLFKADLDANTSSYYIAASKFTPWPNEPTADVFDGTELQGDSSIREELMYGKKVETGDAAFLIAKNVWASNTVYAIYDDADPDLDSKVYFVVNGNSDVFKCISNNRGKPSTEEPVSVTNDVFQLADGYKWKYMYTVSSANNTKFGSSTAVPVDVNPTVTAGAVRGTIDNIVVEAPGNGFTKYAVGVMAANTANGNVVRLASNSSQVNNYYNGMMLYVSSGTGDGTFLRVLQSSANSSGSFAVLEHPVTVDTTSNYVISPEVVIEGNGSGAKAYATVNTFFNQIETVEIIDAGSGYTSAVVSVNDSSGSNEDLRAIISPGMGHGSDVISELNSDRFIVITTFTGDESGNIPTDVSYRKYVLLKDPRYANGALYDSQLFNSMVEMSVNVSSSNTDFVVGEKFYGGTSNAVGIVAVANTTHLKGTVYRGSFLEFETVTTGTSKVTATISNINSPEINAYSGEIEFYQPIDTLERTEFSIEDVGFVITNTSGT